MTLWIALIGLVVCFVFVGWCICALGGMTDDAVERSRREKRDKP